MNKSNNKKYNNKNKIYKRNNKIHKIIKNS